MREVLVLHAGGVGFGVVPAQVRHIVNLSGSSGGTGAGGSLHVPGVSGSVPYCTLAGLLGRPDEPAARAVVAESVAGPVAYGVDSVGEVRTLPPGSLRPLPLLFREELTRCGLLGVTFLDEQAIFLADLSRLHPALRPRD